MKPCSRCQERIARPGQRWCLACHAAYHREWRKTTAGRRCTERDMPRNNVRAKARYAVKRGQIKRLPCERCASERAEKHHDDYSRPLDVRWLCKPCHAAHHRREREAASSEFSQFVAKVLRRSRGRTDKSAA